MNDYIKYGNLGNGTEDSSISGIPLAEREKQADIKKTLADLDRARELCLKQLDDWTSTKNPIYAGVSGKDHIDDFEENSTPDEFRAAMNFNIQKYSKRYGKNAYDL